MRMLRWVLRLYPQAFRDLHGASVEELADETGSTGAVVDAVRALPGAWGIALRARARRRANMSERRPDVLDLLQQDVRYGVRRLLRAPAFTVMAVLTLALGIGANSAIFTIVRAALLRSLPYADAENLMVMLSTRSGEEISVSFPDLLDWQQDARSFEAIAGFTGTSFVATGGEAERLRGQLVTSNLFEVLAAEPILGRTFTAADDGPAAERQVVLTHAIWQRRYGGDASILGRAIVLNGEPFTVIGVMPAGFDFPAGIVYGPTDVYAPMGLESAQWNTRNEHPGIYGIGRLRAGITQQAATAELRSIAARLEQEYPATNREESVNVYSALDVVVGAVRPILLLVFVAVGLVLLIACANVANLLLARASARSRELAVRAALGAGRGRIALQMLTESTLLSLAGCAAGLVVAHWALGLGSPLLANLPRMEGLRLDRGVLLYALTLALVSGAVFGALPVFAIGRGGLDRNLRERSGTVAGSRRLRAALVVGEVALATVLLVGASLLVSSLQRMSRVERGIEPDGVLTFTLSVPEASYARGTQMTRFHTAVADRLAQLPGVLDVGAVNVLPFSGAGNQTGTAPSFEQAMQQQEVRTDVAAVTPGYFDAIGMQLLRGRSFTAADDSVAPPVAVVDETLAANFWPGEDPIGKRIFGGFGSGMTGREVIGVVRHVKNYGVNAESRQEMFVPQAQFPAGARMHYTVRVTGDPASYATQVRAAVASVDPNVPVYAVRTMRDVVDATTLGPRLGASLSTGFAILAALLAAIGIYGVLALNVAQRTREVGVRMALGARSGQVVVLVLRQAAALAVAGVVTGALLAFAASRYLESVIFDVSVRHPAAYLIAPPALIVVALLAAALPAWRAARISPLVTLQQD